MKSTEGLNNVLSIHPLEDRFEMSLAENKCKNCVELGGSITIGQA